MRQPETSRRGPAGLHSRPALAGHRPEASLAWSRGDPGFGAPLSHLLLRKELTGPIPETDSEAATVVVAFVLPPPPRPAGPPVRFRESPPASGPLCPVPRGSGVAQATPWFHDPRSPRGLGGEVDGPVLGTLAETSGGWVPPRSGVGNLPTGSRIHPSARISSAASRGSPSPLPRPYALLRSREPVAGWAIRYYDSGAWGPL